MLILMLRVAGELGGWAAEHTPRAQERTSYARHGGTTRRHDEYANVWFDNWEALQLILRTCVSHLYGALDQCSAAFPAAVVLTTGRGGR